MTAKLLFVGDIHLGRLPTRIPEQLAEYEITAHSCGPAAAWAGVVEYAISRGPDAVVLAGDVVESQNARFGAYPQLLSGVRKLTDAGIQVCGVAGNHDRETLPRLAKSIEGFDLLGEGGSWSEIAVPDAEDPIARVVGWSFSGSTHRDRLPTESFPTGHGEGLVIGVAHCDLDAVESHYAPVSRAALRRTGAAAWLLGHVHKPGIPQDDRPIGYLGSVVGLDPTETGPHGPWWAEVGRDGGLTLTHIPLAPLRWESIEVQVPPELEPSGLLGLLTSTLMDYEIRLGDELDDCRVLGVRVRLVGEVEDHGGLIRELSGMLEQGLIIPLRGRPAFIDKVVNDTSLQVDLDSLAEGVDPPGLLARELIVLERGGEYCGELVRAARNRLAAVLGQGQFAELGDVEPGDEEVRSYLVRAGRVALDDLLRADLRERDES